MADDLVSVRYLVDDVDAALEFYTTNLGFTELTNFAAGLRRCRTWQPAAAAQWTRELRSTADARRATAPCGRLESDSSDRRRHPCRDCPPARRRRRVPQRHRDRPRWRPDRARRPVREPRRALPTRCSTDATVTVDGTLQRSLGLSDAVVIGAGSTIGAGVFAAWSPAADAAGNGLAIGRGSRRWSRSATPLLRRSWLAKRTARPTGSSEA